MFLKFVRGYGPHTSFLESPLRPSMFYPRWRLFFIVVLFLRKSYRPQLFFFFKKEIIRNIIADTIGIKHNNNNTFRH